MLDFERNIAVDMGTSSTLLFEQGKGVVAREPTVVAVDKFSGKILKIGQDAQKMLGRTPANIVAIHPISAGVISDYEISAQMLRELVSRITSFSLLKPRILVCVPSSITGVEERAMIDAAIEAGGRRVYLLETAVATALGAGVDISKADGHMVIDIGGGTTGTAVISNGKVIASVDDATGGHHVTLAMSGALSVPYEEAELKKRGTDNRQYAPIVRPVFERISDIVKAHISGHAVDTVYLTGGTCCFPGIAPLFEKELGIKVECPDYPLLLTPLAIACLPLMEG